MAKQMFYTLKEAAERLGLDEQAIKDMAAEGKLQQFRDRDQLMFKRDEVEGIAGGVAAEQAGQGGQAGGSDDSGELSIGSDDSGSISLSDADAEADSPGGLSPDDTSLTTAGTGGETGGESTAAQASDTGGSDTGTFELAQEDTPSPAASSGGEQDPNQGTGVSVFDADEIETADPAAQTQVNRPMIGDEEAALENVGSGSGLLDLTRESDDTSLGAAELLDEIYPGGEEAGGGQGATAGPSDDSGMASALGSSGVLEATQTATGSVSDLEATEAGATQMELEQPGDALSEAPVGAVYGSIEPDDPAGSGFGAGMLLGVTITLIIGLVVGLGALLNVQVPLLEQMRASQSTLMIWCGGLLAVSIVFGIIGLLIGKATASSQPVASAVE